MLGLFKLLWGVQQSVVPTDNSVGAFGPPGGTGGSTARGPSGTDYSSEMRDLNDTFGGVDVESARSSFYAGGIPTDYTSQGMYTPQSSSYGNGGAGRVPPSHSYGSGQGSRTGQWDEARPTQDDTGSYDRDNERQHYEHKYTSKTPHLPKIEYSKLVNLSLSNFSEYKESIGRLGYSRDWHTTRALSS
jgi:hypothetical protein